VLLPSGPEASMLTGQADQADACRSLVERGIPMVVLKRGRDGSTVFTADESIDVPSLAVTEVDPTGAGDCYDAGFVVGLLQGWDPARAARFANVVGALSVTRQGPMEGVPYLAEVMARM
jgi:tagatose kinase